MRFSFYLRLVWLWLSFYLNLTWVWLSFLFLHWGIFDSVKRSESWWWWCRERKASPRQSTEEAILWGAAVASINNQTSGFQEVFFTHWFFYFEWPAWQDVIREHDDVLKFFYLTEKWNMRPPPAGELLALPSEAWNAVHKEFQKIFKTQRKNDKCSGSSREDRPTRRWKKELLLGGLRVR